MSRALLLLSILVTLMFAPASLFAQGRDDVVFQSGNLKVRLQFTPDSKGNTHKFHLILRDQINFGYCYDDRSDRRMPTTYYHPDSPIGMVFKKYSWFAGKEHDNNADFRLPTSLAALSLGQSPLAAVSAMWTEPPVAVIGMAAGTPAAYARPYQHFDFYEPTKTVIDLNDCEEKGRFFHYLGDARDRGAIVKITPGSPREQLAKGDPQKYYRVMILEACSGEDGEKIFLDLFTTEGIAQCMEHLTDDGILCVHTSHRYLDLPRVLAAIGRDLKLHVRRGHDQAPGRDSREFAELGHFSSEWVMLSRNQKALDAACKTPANYEEKIKNQGRPLLENYWSNTAPLEKAWTDKGPNLLHSVLRGHPFAQRYSATVGPLVDAIGNLLPTKMQRNVLEWGHLPRPVENWMVQSQLRTSPQVEKLWP